METRARYALIGGFTLLVVALAVGFVVWFSGADQRTERRAYKLVFNSSVSGLARGAQVLFNGLRVGEVTELELGEDPREVNAVIEINPRTPVKSDTRARLEYQGLTGVASVALLGGTSSAPPLTSTGGGLPIMYAERSDYQNIVETLQTLAAKLDGVIDKVDSLIGDSSGSLKATAKNIEVFSQVLADNSGGVSQTLNSTKDLVAKLSSSADKLDRILGTFAGTPGARGTFDELSDAVKSIRKLSDSLGPGVRQYEALAADGRRALDELNRTMRSLEKNPQQLLFGSKPTMPEYSGH